MQERGFIVDDNEINRLMERIDKDRDGKIAYNEVRVDSIYEFCVVQG